jgi:hypothetical protein
MKTTIEKVIGKPSDYWVCPNCNSLNWYENEQCNDNWGVNCDRTNPLDDYSPTMENYEQVIIEQKEEMNNEVLEWIKKEIAFWMSEYDYSEEDCDKIKINV